MTHTPTPPSKTRHHARLARLLAATLCAIPLASCTGGTGNTPGNDWSLDCGQPGGKVAAKFDVELECLSGDDPISLGATDGKPLVITLWASWCQPCREESPAFSELHDKVGEQVRIIGVDSRDKRDAGTSFASDFEMKYPSVYDPDGKIMRQNGISALPATFLINSDGKTVATYRNGDLTASDLLTAVDEHFEVKP